MYELFRLIVVLYVKLKFRLRIHGGGNIPAGIGKGGFIIAANHQKYYDPVIIARVFKAHFSFMAKSELFEKNRFFAWLIKFCGAFPVVRGAGDNKAIDTALNDLKKGRVFVIFPEGTRSKDGKIGRAKSGVALIAARAGVPVIPVCIMYGLCGDKKRADIAIGEAIEPAALSFEGAQRGDRTALKNTSAVIMDSIKDLQQKIYEKTDNSGKDGNNNA